MELLAIPTVRGLKSPTERFAGAEATYTIEALMQNNWALQSGTSHFLGQNFARAFDVNFQNADNQQELVWATSWGVSTRLIGARVLYSARPQRQHARLRKPQQAHAQLRVVDSHSASKH